MSQYPVLKATRSSSDLGKARLCAGASKRLPQAVPTSRWSEYNCALSRRARYLSDFAAADNQGYWTHCGRVVEVQVNVIYSVRIVPTSYGAVKLGMTPRIWSRWIIFAYSLLNIVGNFASGTLAEKLVFAPISIVVAFLVFRLAIEK